MLEILEIAKFTYIHWYYTDLLWYRVLSISIIVSLNTEILSTQHLAPFSWAENIVLENILQDFFSRFPHTMDLKKIVLRSSGQLGSAVHCQCVSWMRRISICRLNHFSIHFGTQWTVTEEALKWMFYPTMNSFDLNLGYNGSFCCCELFNALHRLTKMMCQNKKTVCTLFFFFFFFSSRIMHYASFWLSVVIFDWTLGGCYLMNDAVVMLFVVLTLVLHYIQGQVGHRFYIWPFSSGIKWHG